MRIVSWNVNGLRSVLSKGFREWYPAARADVVGVQEVRATREQVETDGPLFAKVHGRYDSAKRPGYSGVALFSKRAPDEVVASLGSDAFDDEGRFQLARFGKLVVVNAYFPNGNGKNRDLSRIPYKLAFYAKVFELLEPMKKKGVPILVMGDFNTAHKEIDLARPKDNVKTSGFRPEEREEFDRWVRSGWTDTFRMFEPAGGHYSWWSNRPGVREKNVGWRIDYVLASQGAVPFVKKAFIHGHVTGSDHCPVGVDLADDVVGPPSKSKR
ncbi:MAG: exodeoxyribonuclease III [Polyangiaceae bacterium]